MEQKVVCAIYTRVSTDNQAEVEFNSCEAQKHKIISFINSQENMAVYKVYSDLGFTGANLNRPAFSEMLNDLRQGRFNLIISYKIDRLTRSPKDFYHLIEIFDKHGVDFISVTERFDTSTPSGRLLRNIMLTFAQFERELASERTKDKLLQRAAKGMWNGGVVPFGYRNENKRLVINRDEADIIKALFEDYISDVPLAKIAKQSRLSKSRVYTILRNSTYIGKIHWGGKLTQGNHNAIVSEDLFNLAQRQHENARYKKTHRKHALAGLIQCRECNSYMTPCHTTKKKKRRKERYNYYRCTSTFKKDWQECSTKQVNADRLERYILENVERIAIDRQYIDNLVFSLNYRGGLPSKAEATEGRIGLFGKNPVSSKNPLVSGVSPHRGGLELTEDPSPISAEIVAQTLSRLAKSLKISSGIEKNIQIKKQIKSIKYCVDSIELNLLARAGEKEKPHAEGVGNFVCKEDKTPRVG